MGEVDRRGQSNRKVVLIDVEDMLFGEQHGHDLARSQDRSAEILELAQAQRPTDTIIVFCKPNLMFLANSLFPSARTVIVESSHDTDRDLIEALELHSAADRYDEVCVVSGGEQFAKVAQAARAAGMTVRIIAPRPGRSTASRVYQDVDVPEDLAS